MTLFFFFQNALESLKQRAELVITENETLFDQLKTQAITQVLSAEKQTDFEVCLCANWFVHCSHTAIFKLIIGWYSMFKTQRRFLLRKLHLICTQNYHIKELDHIIHITYI